MSLLASAETAQDIASGFHKFLDLVPEQSTEITGLIAECFGLSKALRELAEAISDPRVQGRYVDIKGDLQTLLRSLGYTFDDVHRLFGGLGRTTHVSLSAGYRQVWREIETHFQAESRNTLSVRLKFCRNFLDDMICIVWEGSPPDDISYDEIYERIAGLLDVQESRLEHDLNNLSLGALGSTSSLRQRSFERRRTRRPPPLATEIPRPKPNRSNILSGYGNDYDYAYPPPVVPDVPNSPTTTASTSTFSNPSSTSSAVSHWVPKVFEQSRSTTPLKALGPVSACYGREMAPGTSSRIAEEHEKLVELPFEGGDLVVRFYLRSSDQRARIHCRNLRHNNPRKKYCLPLTALRIERDKSTLRLCCLSPNGRSKELWACLRFPSYESERHARVHVGSRTWPLMNRVTELVLFFCTFLALKAEDTENRARQTEDHVLRGEDLLYSGKILDDQFEHALSLLRDRDSDGIRLQASVLGGELKRKPVWTAFITHQISSRRWMRRVNSRTIHLADLQPYIFSSDYLPQLGPGGEHELLFAKSTDADDFVDRIKDLKDDY